VARVLIIGFGNPLLTDEGVGIRAVELLQARELPPDIKVMDGGTSAIDILPFLEGVERVLILDAVAGTEPPGTIYRLEVNQIKYPEGREMSLHDIDVPTVLRMCATMGKPVPYTTIFGMQPASLEEGMGLTPPVEAALPRLIDVALKEASDYLESHPSGG